MPGLTLTLSQAARLFSLNIADRERVLQSLVQDGHLATNGRNVLVSPGGVRQGPAAGRASLRLLSGDWQADNHGRSAFRWTIDFDVTVVRIDEPLRRWQSEAEPRDFVVKKGVKIRPRIWSGIPGPHP